MFVVLSVYPQILFYEHFWLNALLGIRIPICIYVFTFVGRLCILREKNVSGTIHLQRGKILRLRKYLKIFIMYSNKVNINVEVIEVQNV